MSDINPSTGLPTVNGYGSNDVSGNAYGSQNFDDSSDARWKKSNSNSSSKIATILVGTVLAILYVVWLYILLK